MLTSVPFRVCFVVCSEFSHDNHVVDAISSYLMDSSVQNIRFCRDIRECRMRTGRDERDRSHCAGIRWIGRGRRSKAAGNVRTCESGCSACLPEYDDGDRQSRKNAVGNETRTLSFWQCRNPLAGRWRRHQNVCLMNVPGKDAGLMRHEYSRGRRMRSRRVGRKP